MLEIPESFGDGGSGLSRGQKIRTANDGDIYLRDILSELQTNVEDDQSDIDDLQLAVTTLQTDVDTLETNVHGAAVTVAAAQALTAANRGGFLYVTSALFGFGLFLWNAASVINDTTSQLAIKPTDIDSGDPGRWDRVDSSFPLVVTVTSATANDEVLYTLPAGVRLQIVGRPFADVSVGFVSGDSAALGLSSSNAAYNTAGDLFGGATGSLAAALTIGIRGGTIGDKIDAQGLVVLIAADTIKANILVGTFSTGTANIYIPVLRV